ncbi:hypothetical protein [Roseivirga echinicomitans]|uniref:Uncharacterized protein n=1 Tax=Roseivirga echinicomitans TaxID=296218 RepID=A0A150X349_9BACT|nr:hypothetical protein [Roseivirga echinicomitans]KYG73149.1 hypothetical protein AWN68_10710 [Roseivirga echinicomitans]
MKLAHYQIEHITAYVKDQNIWYYDVQHELVDHIASSVEDGMSKENLTFTKAFTQSIEAINCKTIQRKRMRASTSAVHRELLKELVATATSIRILALGAIFLACYLMFYSALPTESLVKSLKTLSISAVIIPLLLSLFDRKNRPYNYTTFISIFNGLFFYVIILNGIEMHGAIDSIKPQSLFYPVFFTILFTCIYLSYSIAFKQYQKIKKHVAYR